MTEDIHQRVLSFLNGILFFLGVFSISILIFRFGFHLNGREIALVHTALVIVIIVFLFQEVFRWFLARDLMRQLRARWLESLFAVLLGISVLTEQMISRALSQVITVAEIEDLFLAYLGLSSTALFLAEGVKYIRNTDFFSRIEMTPARLFVVSFLTPILLGTLLLKLPKATVAGIDWIDALFTATSAVCVTGLIVVDTATAFTPFGKGLILFLIQIGGLGIMTLTLSFGILFSGGLGVKERLVFSDLLAEDRLGEVGKLLTRITSFTLVTELIGAVLLYLSRERAGGVFDLDLFLNSVFHSVSAFCNAGFSLFTLGLYQGVVQDNVAYSFVIMGLIILGGLGVPVLNNLWARAMSYRRSWQSGKTLLRVQTKLVLAMTAILIVGGTLVIFLIERNHSLAGLPLAEQLRQSLFFSVSSRSAGYNIWPTESLSVGTAVFILFLMWIGGSPMSTAGGIKTTTFAAAFLNLRSILLGKSRVEVFNREIEPASILRSYAIIFGSILVIAAASILMIILEPTKNILDLTFEVVSAFGVVGLSRGVTPDLSELSKLLIIFLMFTGRIGLIVFFGSFFTQGDRFRYRLLKEKLPIT